MPENLVPRRRGHPMDVTLDALIPREDFDASRDGDALVKLTRRGPSNDNGSRASTERNAANSSATCVYRRTYRNTFPNGLVSVKQSKERQSSCGNS
jgi:hypothetical protein